jgi:RNA polymerase sigma-70 factor, ECF subfamily
VGDTDLELVRRMLRGDEAAFERFFDATYPALYRFALPRLDFDRDAAAEVAQATICKAIRKLHTFRGEAALLTWLNTFCRRELYAHTTRHHTRVEVMLVDDDPEVRAALESLRRSDADDLDAALDRTRIAVLVQRVLDHLPAHYADALEWKYIDEVSVQEVAQRLGVGAKAAESLLTRARRAFRDALQTLVLAWPGPDPFPAFAKAPAGSAVAGATETAPQRRKGWRR